MQHKMLSCLAAVMVGLTFVNAAPTPDFIGPEPVYVGEIVLSDQPYNLTKRAGRGHAAFDNRCGFSVWTDVCWQPINGVKGTDGCIGRREIPAFRRYQEDYTNLINNGRSIKTGVTPDWKGGILQLEYTVGPTPNDVFYDVSNVDGDPFRWHAFDIWSNNPANFQVHCRQPSSNCYSIFPVDRPTGGLVYRMPVTDSVVLFMCVPNT